MKLGGINFFDQSDETNETKYWEKFAAKNTNPK